MRARAALPSAYGNSGRVAKVRPVNATAVRRDRRVVRAPPPARRAQASPDAPQPSPAPSAARAGQAPRDELGQRLQRCCRARAARTSALRDPVLQRMHVDGATAPAAVCKGFAAVAKLAANPYPTTLANVFGVGDSPEVQSNRLAQNCRAWLVHFDNNPADHARFAKLDFVTHDVAWPLATTNDTWARLRERVVGWRTDAEEQYVLDSAVSEKNKPDVEEYEQQLKLAWSGVSGAFNF